MESIQRIFAIAPYSAINITDSIGAIIGALLASLVVLALYQVHYYRSNLGASVHRMFLIGGPAITALLLAIQSSLPLSLGLLGALSIVRFRTPIKDPAEIGYVLLLIAAAIGCATMNYWLVLILLAVATATVLVSQILANRLPGFGRGFMVINIEGDGASDLVSAISDMLTNRLQGARLDSISFAESRCSLQYHFSKQSRTDWSKLKQELDELAAPNMITINAR